MCKRNDKWQGSKWCRQSTRLAIYLRDGLACVYCGAALEENTQLTLDHVRPVSKGGDNKAGNLVTACSRCNSSRGSRTVAAFAAAVALYLSAENPEQVMEQIVRHVNNCKRRSLPRAQARAMLKARGTVRAVCTTMEA